MNYLVLALFVFSNYLFAARLFDRQVSDPQDTLEIFILKVEFKKESPDKSITTGDGTFNSAQDDFPLDPSGARHRNDYWLEHLTFAQNYYKQVSFDKLHIQAKVFPEGNKTWVLEKEIVEYNRSTKLSGEKNSELDSVRVDGYLRFLQDAVKKVAQDETSPFDIPLTPGRKRIYMIAHAGANRLVDGGSLGIQGADTPSDFFDAYLGPRDFTFYQTINEYESDSLGIILNRPGVDTLNQLMVVSETSSQDGVNWGINGVIISQIGEALGLPATYDPTLGRTQLGKYDLMDFAGYSSGNGFFPTAPSAWHRQYLGWDIATLAQMGLNSTQKSYIIGPALDASTSHPRIIKVPISQKEYFLIEYRHRASKDDIKVINSKDREFSVHADSIEQLFLDTLCNDKGKQCQPNSSQAEGVFKSAENFDLSLPGSGILVWHINEWLIDELIETGFINKRLEQSGDHFKGISLIEADGVLTMGKEFKNALGQPSFDFGSGRELLPHIHIYDVNGKRKTDTINTIHPWGYGNTGSAQGAFTHLKFKVDWPENPILEKNWHAFTGDSLINVRSDSIKLSIDWSEYKTPGSIFPQTIKPSTHPQSILSFDSLLLMTADSFQLAVKDYQGKSVAKLGSQFRRFKGSALHQINSHEFDWINLSDSKLLRTRWQKSAATDFKWKVTGQTVLKSPHYRAGPLVAHGNVFWVDQEELHYSDSTWTDIPTKMKLPTGFRATQLLYAPAQTSPDYSIYILSKSGELLRWDSQTPIGFENLNLSHSIPIQAPFNNFKEQDFQAVISDFNQDGSLDIFLLSSKGYASFFDLNSKQELSHSPQYYPLKNSSSSITVSDINLDSYPNVLFNTQDKLFVLNHLNAHLIGFPFEYTQGIEEAEMTSPPMVINFANQNKPHILAPSSWGLLYAVNSRGQSLNELPSQENTLLCVNNKLQGTGLLKNCGKSWPLIIGPSVQIYGPSPLPISLAKQEIGYQLYAAGASEVNSWFFKDIVESSNQWITDGSNSSRHFYFDASKLTTTPLTGIAKIEKFLIYPNPVRQAGANALFSILDGASKVNIQVFDITGLQVYDENFGAHATGLHRLRKLNINHLASGVYSAKIFVKFDSKKTQIKKFRFAVIR